MIRSPCASGPLPLGQALGRAKICATFSQRWATTSTCLGRAISECSPPCRCTRDSRLTRLGARAKRASRPATWARSPAHAAIVMQTFATSQSAMMKRKVSKFMVGTRCPVCHGKRLKPESLSVTFCGLDIGDLARLPLDALADVLRPVAEGATTPTVTGDAGAAMTAAARKRAALQRKADGACAHAAAPDVRRTPPPLARKSSWLHSASLRKLLVRVQALTGLGLVTSRSTGRRPRCHPASCSACGWPRSWHRNSSAWCMCWTSRLPDCHPADTASLLTALQRLKDAGNSIFVVEHDVTTMQRADWLVDVGPGAGERGGRVLYSGPPEGLDRDIRVADASLPVRGRHAFTPRTAHPQPRKSNSGLADAAGCTSPQSAWRRRGVPYSVPDWPKPASPARANRAWLAKYCWSWSPPTWGSPLRRVKVKAWPTAA